MNKIYYHDVAGSIPLYQQKLVPGLELFGCRALAVSGPGDWVVLPRAVNEGLSAIERHYETIGLQHGVGYVFGGIESLSRCPASFVPSVYEYTEELCRQSEDACWHQVVRLLGDKNYFVDHCDNLGFLRPVTTKVTYRFDQPRPDRFPVVVKLARSGEGLGYHECNSPQRYEEVVSGLEPPYQVQEYLSPGTRYFLVEYRLGDKGELLPGVVVERMSHRGSVSYQTVALVSRQITAVTDVLAEWAVEMHMKGSWSYEVALAENGQVLLIGCRPRWSGASYPIVVAEKLGITNWETKTFTGLSVSVSDACELGELTYQSRAKEGVIITNWATVSHGRLDVLIAGDKPARIEIANELSHRLRARIVLA